MPQSNPITFQHQTIVLSDIHLGSKWSKVVEVSQFLRENSCQTLILCGDIIDGWAIMRGKKERWNSTHTDFIGQLLDLSKQTKIIYLRGNHDDFLGRLVSLSLPNITIAEDYIYTSGEKRYYVLHGDVFDKVSSSFGWLAKIGDVCYSILLWYNKGYNRRRLKKGKPYYSIAREVKKWVKASVCRMSDFEQQVVNAAHEKGCHGVICGHIHHPQIKQYGSVEYLNSGDWVESLSALIEDFDGNWRIFHMEQPQTSFLK